MREGWTYKTFGEVGSFLRGKSIQKADFIENGFPCIHYGQIHTKFGVSVDKHLSEIPLELYNKSIIASHGDVIIAITSEDLEGSCKSTAWLGDYDVAVSSHAAVYKHNINPKFIAYYLRSKSFYYEKMKYARGFKVVEIKPTDIERIPIPVPPIAEQERIVAELDLLSGIIEKKKEQLKAYDQLAQSIFYTMFGDPITNEKGWELKKLNDLSNVFAGGDVPKDSFSKTKSEKYSIPIYSNGIDNDGLYGYTAKARVSEPSITISGRGTIGFVALRNHPFYPIIRLIVITPIIPIDLVYLKFVCTAMNFKGVGVAIPQLTVPMIKFANIPIPPLSLQQEFAEKVEAIERQKALVQQSIDETQTMFDFTMDKYFG